MKLVVEVLKLVEKINKKARTDVNARFHMTRHELKVQVFDNTPFLEYRPIDVKIRYFQKNESDVNDLIAELKKFIEELK